MLNMESKVLLDICQELGYDVKNQLSGLDPDQRDAIEQRMKRGHGGGTAVAAPPKAVAPALVAPEKKIKVLDSRPRPPQGRPLPAATVPPAAEEAPAAPPAAPPAAAAQVQAPPAQPTPAAQVPKPAAAPHLPGTAAPAPKVPAQPAASAP